MPCLSHKTGNSSCMRSIDHYFLEPCAREIASNVPMGLVSEMRFSCSASYILAQSINCVGLISSVQLTNCAFCSIRAVSFSCEFMIELFVSAINCVLVTTCPCDLWRWSVSAINALCVATIVWLCVLSRKLTVYIALFLIEVFVQIFTFFCDTLSTDSKSLLLATKYTCLLITTITSACLAVTDIMLYSLHCSTIVFFLQSCLD